MEFQGFLKKFGEELSKSFSKKESALLVKSDVDEGFSTILSDGAILTLEKSSEKVFKNGEQVGVKSDYDITENEDEYFEKAGAKKSKKAGYSMDYDEKGKEKLKKEKEGDSVEKSTVDINQLIVDTIKEAGAEIAEELKSEFAEKSEEPSSKTVDETDEFYDEIDSEESEDSEDEEFEDSEKAVDEDDMDGSDKDGDDKRVEDKDGVSKKYKKMRRKKLKKSLSDETEEKVEEKVEEKAEEKVEEKAEAEVKAKIEELQKSHKEEMEKLQKSNEAKMGEIQKSLETLKKTPEQVSLSLEKSVDTPVKRDRSDVARRVVEAINNRKLEGPDSAAIERMMNAGQQLDPRYEAILYPQNGN